MSRLPLVLLCMSVSLAAACAEPEGRSIPYQKLYEPLAAVKKADPQGIVAASLRAESAQDGQPLPADLKIELRHGTAHDPVAVDAQGHFEMPLKADWASTDASLWVNQPRSAVKIVENFTMRPPTATRITYGQLMESLPVMKRIQDQHVDIGGLLASSPLGVELAFDPPGTAQTITVGSGVKARTWTSDANGLVKVAYDATLPPGTPVVLSALPVALKPYSP